MLTIISIQMFSGRIPTVTSDLEAGNPKHHMKKTDSLKSWIVCAVCSVAFCAGSVGFRCAGLLLVSMADEFNVPKGQAVWPITVQSFCYFFGGKHW